MKKNSGIKRVLCVLAGVFVLVGIFPVNLYAAESGTLPEKGLQTEKTAAAEAEIEEPKTEEPEAEEPETVPENVQEVKNQEPAHIETAYTQNTFFYNIVMQGVSSRNSLYLYMPEYWDTKYVYAQIEYKVSQLIQDVASAMTITVNDTPVRSFDIEYTDDSSQTAYVEIPMELLHAGYNEISISAYARLYDEEGCMDDLSDANWLSVSDRSFIQSGYELKAHDRMISYYPYPFISTADKTGKGLTVAVSDTASDKEIAAAMNIAADLGRQTEGKNEISVARYSDVEKTDAERIILVSEGTNLPEEYRQQLNAEDITLSQESAEVLFIENAKGAPVLLIASDNGDCLTEAAYMLMDEDRVTQEKGHKAAVAAQSSKAVMAAEEAKGEEADSYTVAGLAGDGLSFEGPFHQEQTIYLPFAGNYSLRNDGKIDLKFRYSENLDFNRSLITVYWGNIPIASKKLEKDKANGDEISISIPTDAGQVKTGSVRIAFDLEIPDMVCTLRQDQMPWAYVLGESVFYLPLSGEAELSFDTMPSPFSRKGKMEDVLLVVTDHPTTDELSYYAHLLALYAEELMPYGRLSVKRCSEFSKSDADYNIITAGTFENNSLLKELNTYMGFPYSGDGSKFVSNEHLVLSESYAADVAILQLIPSPYADNRSILLTAGITENTLKYADTLVTDEAYRNVFTKDCILVNADAETKAYRLTADSSQRKMPTLVEGLKENKQSVLFTLVSTSVMLMLLIAVIILLLRIKMYHKK